MDGRSLLETVENSIDENEILDEAAREIADDAESGSIAAILFADAAGIDEPGRWRPSDHPEMRETFVRWCRQLAEAELETFMDALTTLSVDERGLRAWRAISVGDDWTVDDLANRPLGIHWTWDPAFAIAHWGSLERTAVMEGRIPVDDVDWRETVRLAVTASNTVGEEREIRATASAVVVLACVSVDGKILDMRSTGFCPAGAADGSYSTFEGQPFSP